MRSFRGRRLESAPGMMLDALSLVGLKCLLLAGPKRSG
jgi:hypothetical protein